MAEFTDVHHNMKGLSEADPKVYLAMLAEENVQFKQAWADPDSGTVFFLSEAPSTKAVQRIHERAGHLADEIHAVPLVVGSAPATGG